MVKNLSAMQETRIWSLGQEGSLEMIMAMHSSILAWRIPWAEGPGGLQSIETQRAGHDWSNWAYIISIYIVWFDNVLLNSLAYMRYIGFPINRYNNQERRGTSLCVHCPITWRFSIVSRYHLFLLMSRNPLFHVLYCWMNCCWVTSYLPTLSVVD